jgi:hypothetical protein
MICKHCGKDIHDHGFLSFRCPRYVGNVIRVGYQDGIEFELQDSPANIQQQVQADSSTNSLT